LSWPLEILAAALIRSINGQWSKLANAGRLVSFCLRPDHGLDVSDALNVPLLWFTILDLTSGVSKGRLRQP
jgi:hypothetical protein